MKKAATKVALVKAITIAVTISKGAGMATYFPSITVTIVRNINAVPTAQSCLAVEI